MPLDRRQPSSPRRLALAGARRLAAALLTLLGLLACLAPPALAGQGRRLALLVGVGSFADPAFTSLAYAANDLEKMRDWLVSPAGGGFNPAEVTVLADARATRAAILAQADRLVRQARPEDLVFLYFSTHGFLTSDQVVGIVCHDTTATGRRDPSGDPIVRREQSLTRDDLYDFLERLPARRRAVVVDVCRGGQLAGEKSLAPADGPPPGAVVDLSADGRRDPQRVTMVLASCLGSERSWESQELQASIFTHYLLEGLKLAEGDLAAAFALARRETEIQAQCEKGYCQTPYLVANPPGRGLVLRPPRKG